MDDFTSGLASGSFRARAMVVIPCSMGSLGAIAQGVGRNLIHRAGEVFLKERRPLILVVRETPLSLIHLRNLVRAAEAGATIFPACPGFYHRPQDLTELARQFAGRVLDHLGLEHHLTRRWGEEMIGFRFSGGSFYVWYLVWPVAATCCISGWKRPVSAEPKAALTSGHLCGSGGC